MFENRVAYIYYVSWNTKSGYHDMLMTCCSPLSHSRLREFEHEGKKVVFGIKKPEESLDDVISEISGQEGAYG